MTPWLKDETSKLYTDDVLDVAVAAGPLDLGRGISPGSHSRCLDENADSDRAPLLTLLAMSPAAGSPVPDGPRGSFITSVSRFLDWTSKSAKKSASLKCQLCYCTFWTFRGGFTLNLF